MKYSFKNDYSEGCHPKILDALTKHNLDQHNGYGLDYFSKNVENIILEKTKSPQSKVYLVSGGTQANLIVISSILRPHESVIAANTGHIFTNETGAIEASGHKVNAITTTDGKLRPEDIQTVLDAHTNTPHQVKQKLVYISNSTEIGTIYTKKELENLSIFCKEKKLYLFMDGARLGHALTAESNNLTWEDVARFTDVYYLGGTKNGALIGEAIVINRPELQEDFGFHLKQKGAMLAKGRLLGIQFQELLKNNLYWDLAKHANQQAMKIKNAFLEIGCNFIAKTETNQIFPILELHQIEKLADRFDFYIWKKISSQQAAIRIITSWATKNEIVDDFCQEIKKLK